MNFKPIDAAVPIEVDPLTRMFEIADFTPAQGAQIRVECFNQMNDMSIEVLEEQDPKNLADRFSCKPVGSYISSGIARTKRLIGMIHWFQDHKRMLLTVSVLVVTTQNELQFV